MSEDQHQGDLIVTGVREQSGQVTGTTYVKTGGRLLMHGQLAGGLIIEPGGFAVVHGQCSRNIINYGTLEVYGQVVGRILGNPPSNALGSNQVAGDDLEVPYRGTTFSFSETF